MPKYDVTFNHHGSSFRSKIRAKNKQEAQAKLAKRVRKEHHDRTTEKPHKYRKRGGSMW